PLTPQPPTSTLFPYTTLFRSHAQARHDLDRDRPIVGCVEHDGRHKVAEGRDEREATARGERRLEKWQRHPAERGPAPGAETRRRDRKSTRLNSSHVAISYAVF